MKKTILTILLALIAVAGQAKKTIVWETPTVAYSDVPYFVIQKVEMTKERTALYVSIHLLPGAGFQISRGSYLQANGKQYAIAGSDSLELSKWTILDDSAKKNFVLYFKPLPLNTKEFDFIEGLAPNDFKVFGLHDKDYMIPAAPVPADFIPDDAEDDQLAELKYDATPATIYFKSLNYRKGMNTGIEIQYIDLKNPSKTEKLEIHLNDEGEASVSLPIGVPQLVYSTIFNVPWFSMAFVYLASGKEVTLLIDMLHDDSSANTKFVGYKGYFAKTDKAWYQQAADKGKGANHQKSVLDMEEVQEKHLVFGHSFVSAAKDEALSDAKGFKADLARYCYYLPQVLDAKKVEKPLIEDKNLSEIYDKYVAEYQQAIAANKQGLASNVHYLDMTEVAPENILQTILDKHQGKTILVDLWATWCGPCKLGHEKMKPLKEELKDKDIVYIYIAMSSSKYEDWKAYIADIPGEHYFLTEEQERYISKQYECTAIPFYVIYNAKGEQTFKQQGFSTIDTIREAIEKALNNK
jgi:thiol-disulfide isomerase/thioredoxin